MAQPAGPPKSFGKSQKSRSLFVCFALDSGWLDGWAFTRARRQVGSKFHFLHTHTVVGHGFDSKRYFLVWYLLADENAIN